MFTPDTLTRGVAALALLGSLTLTACDSGEPDPGGAGDEELITQVTLTLTNAGDAADVVTLTMNDPDGDGNDPQYAASGTLRAGASYDAAFEIRDTVNDEDITEEIREEAEEHLFRYAFVPGTLGSVQITDTESDYTSANENGGDYGVGLEFRVTAAAAGSGELEVILYHFDDAPKTSSTATSDETDLDLLFPVTVAPPAL